MLVLVAAWAALSLLVGLAVVKAIRRADIPQAPTRPTGGWATRTAPVEPDTRRPTDAARTAHPSGRDWSTTRRAA